MTNDLQQARVEAAARAIYDEWRSPDYFTWEQAVEGRNANPDPTFPHIVDRFRGQARAALVAAQGAAPQEECDCGAGPGSAVCKKVCATRAPVLPSSGVDEDALAGEIGRHKLVHVSVSRKSAFCACNPSITAGVDDNRAWFEGHRARAVAEWLKGQGR